MADREAAEVGRGLQVDGQRPRPMRLPVRVGRVVAMHFVDDGVCWTSTSMRPPACSSAALHSARFTVIGQVGRSTRRRHASSGPSIVAGGSEQGESGSANAAAGAGDEDVHGGFVADPPRGRGGGPFSEEEWWRGLRAGHRPPRQRFALPPPVRGGTLRAMPLTNSLVAR